MYHSPSLLIGRPAPDSVRRSEFESGGKLCEVIVLGLRGIEPRLSSEGPRIGRPPGKPWAELFSTRLLVGPISKEEVRVIKVERL
jgi:hypothetical protein